MENHQAGDGHVTQTVMSSSLFIIIIVVVVVVVVIEKEDLVLSESDPGLM